MLELRQLLLFLIPMQSLQHYTIVLRPDDNGTFVAYVRAIAVCHSWGKTIEEAQSELVHVFEMIRDEYQEAGRKLPGDVEAAMTSIRVFSTQQKYFTSRVNFYIPPKKPYCLWFSALLNSSGVVTPSATYIASLIPFLIKNQFIG